MERTVITKVSFGAAVREFDDYAEAMKFAKDFFEKLVGDGMARDEAASAIVITTVETETCNLALYL